MKRHHCRPRPAGRYHDIDGTGRSLVTETEQQAKDVPLGGTVASTACTAGWVWATMVGLTNSESVRAPPYPATHPQVWRIANGTC